MKYIFVIVIAALPYKNLSSQSISNSKWKGTLLIPQAVDVKLIFKKDTLYLTNETNDEVGTILFKQQKDTLVIRKVSGSSPCSEQSLGIYLIEWLENRNKFRLHGLSDECEGRMGVFTVNSFEKMH